MSSIKEKRANQQLFEKADFDLSDLLGGSKAKSLDALAKGTKAETADPIGAIDYENLTNEQAAGQEISATLAAFKARAKTEQERFEAATDSEFWLGVCFQTRAQKEAFLQGVNMLQHGDKYIDGELLAKRMGIALPAADVPYNVSARPDKKLAAMVLEKEL
ncbi:hypothetical protein [Rhodoferax sp.]|uniref:hypothetical protein n=1 Tax=Rhodoferax sp. TaxID=50421 RepID=UPI0027688E40|nr:hypothetical protein [Rhodoferax sp.]